MVWYGAGERSTLNSTGLEIAFKIIELLVKGSIVIFTVSY
jgi:hypothetical protein